MSRKQLIKMDGHKWSRTSQVRETNRRARVDEYFRMKLQWKSMSEEQQNKWVQKEVTVLSWLSNFRINQSMQIEIFPFFYRFSGFRERKTQIEKDIGRTDRWPFFSKLMFATKTDQTRCHPFFEGENNPNVALLEEILMTYVMYNFDLGYVQVNT